MASLNEVRFIGNIGQEPELKVLNDGSHLVKFSMCTNEYATKDEIKTLWHSVVFFGKDLKWMSELKKGTLVHFSGKVDYQTYTNDKDQKVTKTQYRGHKLLVLTARNKNSSDVEGEPDGNDLPF